MPTLTTSDGVKLATRSGRRFGVFGIADDSRASVVKRTDSLQTASQAYIAARRHRCRVVIVDFRPNPAVTTQPARVVKDTADA